VPIPKLATAIVIGSCAVWAACGSTEALSPAGPLGFSTPRSTAVITGRVTGVPLTATASGTRARPQDHVASLTVTIVGTDITTAVNGFGLFELTGVPPGDVTLRFSGGGVTGAITLTGVAAGDRIHIVVTVNENGARLDRETRDDDDDDGDDDNEDDDDEFEGLISGLSGTCPSITFTVAGRTVNTNSSTRFENPCVSIANGTRVEVEGDRQANGSILATEVEIED
jgi:hypothetical protein